MYDSYNGNNKGKNPVKVTAKNPSNNTSTGTVSSGNTGGSSY